MVGLGFMDDKSAVYTQMVWNHRLRSHWEHAIYTLLVTGNMYVVIEKSTRIVVQGGGGGGGGVKSTFPISVTHCGLVTLYADIDLEQLCLS